MGIRSIRHQPTCSGQEGGGTVTEEDVVVVLPIGHRGVAQGALGRSGLNSGYDGRAEPQWRLTM